MRNIKIIVEYDGSNYCGWQKQKNEKMVTVQQRVEEALYKITGESIEVIGSSRTDSGVHARGYSANFFTNSKIAAEKFPSALNRFLPKDIVIIKAEEMPLDFHSRYSSKGKTYSYTILNRKEIPAIGRNYVYHYKYELNVEAMRVAAEFLIGTHDFTSFKNTGSSVKTSVRTVTAINIEKHEDTIKIYLSADGFLYNMARIIVGNLIEVGSGRKKTEDILKILQQKDRQKAGKASPANGLCLEEVFY